jgi:hypothetical protein
VSKLIAVFALALATLAFSGAAPPSLNVGAVHTAYAAAGEDITIVHEGYTRIPSRRTGRVGLLLPAVQR